MWSSPMPRNASYPVCLPTVTAKTVTIYRSNLEERFPR